MNSAIATAGPTSAIQIEDVEKRYAGNGFSDNPIGIAYFFRTGKSCAVHYNFVIDRYRNVDGAIKVAESFKMTDSGQVDQGRRIANNDHD